MEMGEAGSNTDLLPHDAVLLVGDADVYARYYKEMVNANTLLEEVQEVQEAHAMVDPVNQSGRGREEEARGG